MRYVILCMVPLSPTDNTARCKLSTFLRKFERCPSTRDYFRNLKTCAPRKFRSNIKTISKTFLHNEDA